MALSGGEPDGPCFPPTVLHGVTPQVQIYAEESFGPVVAVIAVDSPDEAVRVANDTDYGLSAACICIGKFGRTEPAAE